VLCGLCLPHCPTYLLTLDENNSPRGRISLIRAMAEGRLDPGAAIQSHLSSCLSCQACEQACPSGVQYGRIIEYGRGRIHPQRRALGERIGLKLLASRPALRFAAGALRVADRTGMRSVFRKIGALRLAYMKSGDDLLPVVPSRRSIPKRIPASGVRRGEVMLFVGCVTSLIDTTTVLAAIRVLAAYGYEVVVPDDQACCGGLHREAGDEAGADSLLNLNRKAFRPDSDAPVVVLASGCASALTGPRDDTPVPDRFDARIVEIHAFLSSRELPSGMAFKPRQERVLVQDPCSLRNGLRSHDHVYSLLRKIPRLDVVPLRDNQLCCGGAGSYPIRQPAVAGRLAAPKVDAILSDQRAMVVTANLGCALHLTAELRKKGATIQLRHPITLVAEQLVELKPSSA